MSKHKGRVSPRRRAAAVTVLSSIAADENAPAHSRVRAAAALVAAANREDDDADDPKGKRGRPPLLVLPDNGRDGPRSEICRNPDGVPYMVVATDPAELERLTAQATAELDRSIPTTTLSANSEGHSEPSTASADRRGAMTAKQGRGGQRGP